MVMFSLPGVEIILSVDGLGVRNHGAWSAPWSRDHGLLCMDLEYEISVLVEIGIFGDPPSRVFCRRSFAVLF